MAAEQNKCGNVPAHDKHADGNPHNRCTYRIYITQIFRSQEQCISTKCLHEAAVDERQKVYTRKQALPGIF